MTVALKLSNSDFAGETLLVQFDNGVSTRVQATEYDSPDGGRFYITVAQLVSASLVANYSPGHSGEWRVGDADTPVDGEETAGTFRGFRWTGTAEFIPSTKSVQNEEVFFANATEASTTKVSDISQSSQDSISFNSTTLRSD